MVVQGPVFGDRTQDEAARLTKRGLQSVRQQLPGAEIVLSTWEGADVAGLDFDRLVLSPDPGTARFREAPGIERGSNVNRMIVSTLAGLRATERPYVLKARTDLWMRSARFLQYFGRHPARAAEARVFGERILVHDHYTRFPDRCPRCNYLLHPSDCFQFGRREDLLTLWDVPLWNSEVSGPLELVNEQYVWVTCLRKFMDVPFEHWSASSGRLRDLAELTLANNLVVLTRHQFGIEAQKLGFDLQNWVATFSHREWQRLYCRLCGGSAECDADLILNLKRSFFALSQWPRLYAVVRRICNTVPQAFARF